MNATIPQESALLKLQEAANYLNVSKGTVRNIIDRGALSVVRLGTAVRVRLRDLDTLAGL
jgi:excisionase family DNA binding protein